MSNNNKSDMYGINKHNEKEKQKEDKYDTLLKYFGETVNELKAINKRLETIERKINKQE